jgi:hypothetical protein
MALLFFCGMHGGFVCIRRQYCRELKNAAGWEYRVRLVCCFLPFVILFRSEQI